MSKKLKQTDTNKNNSSLKDNLNYYKNLIDTDLASYSKEIESISFEQFGEYSLIATQLFTSILSRGGKRIRGSLAMVSYFMNGGTDEKVALQAARAVEIMQTYLLIIDDICDRSPTRRGGPTAHEMAKKWHIDNHLKDDPTHFGEAIANITGCLAMHLAFDTILKLNINNDIKVKAMANANDNMIITAHGQYNDIYNGVLQTTDSNQLENTLIWKTAYYTFINPLQFGAVLAGVEGEALDTLSDYGLSAGRAFQIIDDKLGIFGNEFESGKSPLDDIKEGKRTIMMAYAIENSAKSDSYFLESCLGNQHLTNNDFEKCKSIITDSGALNYAKAESQKSADIALNIIEKTKYWDKSSRQFLQDLVQYIVVRNS